jgi:hypothetical protein
MSEFVNRPRAWLLVALLLAAYIGLSSVLGLVLLIMSEGLLGVLLVWSTSIAADIVFVIGSIAGAVAGVTVAKSRRGSIALTAVIIWLTYGIAAEIALTAFSSLAQDASPTVSPDNLPNVGIVLADAPLLGLTGVAFASIVPTLLRERLRRLLTTE